MTQVLPAVPIYGKAAAPFFPSAGACGAAAGRFQKGGCGGKGARARAGPLAQRPRGGQPCSSASPGPGSVPGATVSCPRPGRAQSRWRGSAQVGGCGGRARLRGLPCPSSGPLGPFFCGGDVRGVCKEKDWDPPWLPSVLGAKSQVGSQVAACSSHGP